MTRLLNLIYDMRLGIEDPILAFVALVSEDQAARNSNAACAQVSLMNGRWVVGR